MKTRKILSILLVIAMLMGLLCIGASATNYATGIAVYVYKSANDYTVYELGTLTDGPSALDAFEQADSTSAATYTTATNGSWLYTINGNLASYSASDYTVQNNDFLAFYLVPDYTEDTLITPSYYTEWVINGVLQSVTTTHLLGNDIGMEIGLNYAHPTVNYGSASSTYQAKSANSPLTNIDGFLFISGSATDHNVLKTCYPVKLRSMDSTWMNVMRGQAAQLKVITDDISATEIGTNAKTDLDSKAADAVGAYPYPPVLMGKLIDFEDAFAALTYSVDARLDFVSFTEDLAVTSPFFPYHTAYTVQSSTADPTAVPNSFSMTVEPKDSTASVSVTSTSTGVSITGTGNTRSIILPANATSTIKVTITKSSVSKEYTFTLTTPAASASPNGATPTSVVSFLPIGQFATGTGWGSMYTNYSNADAQNASDAVQKFVNGYTSTGVSLGAFGGYIEFYFEDGITNDPRNPYGVDLVVYGNAFGGNPEAGAVQVSENGSKWYELAGSRYYDTPAASATPANVWHNGYTGTLQNADVTYTLNSNNITASMTDGTTTFPANPFTSTTAWWPTTSEYPEFTNYATDPNGNAHTDTDVTVSYGSSTLTYGGVTAVQDSDTTAFYAFGYADVTPNGTPGTYGDAVNPYTAYTSTKTGGDGFDLEWAVEIGSGIPVNVNNKTFHYVRVYSAVLDNGTFGETSTEVCGIYTAYRTATEEALDEETGVGRTAKPTIRFGPGTSTSSLSFSNSGAVVYKTISAGDTNTFFTVKVNASTADNIFINSTRATSGTDYTFSVPAAGKTKTVRFVVQTGDAAPYIVTLVVTKAASK